MAFFASTPSFAAKWPITPYLTVHSGLNIKTDWSAPWDKESYYICKKFWPTGAPCFFGVGSLINPVLLEGWMISIEAIAHTKIVEMTSQPKFKEHGGFISGKVSFPQSEGIENFLGVGLGGLWLEKPLDKKDENATKEDEGSTKKDKPLQEEKASGLSLTGMLYAGRHWHLNNGSYLTLRATYLLPSGENNKQSVSFTLGWYGYLI